MILKGHRGFTLTQALIAIALGSVSLVAVANVMGWVSTLQGNSMSRVQLEAFRNTLVTLSRADDFATKTLVGELNAQAFSCINTNQPCTTDGSVNGPPITDQPFALYNSDGSIFLNGLGDGYLDFNANPCARGVKCPYQMSLTWSAVCAPGSCVDPQIKISTKFSRTPASSGTAINPGNYSISVYLADGAAGSGPSTPPICTGIIQSGQNSRTFTATWTAGSGNGGSGGCKLQYTNVSNVWRDIGSPSTVSCDSDGSAAGVMSLPNDGWFGGAWSSTGIRLVRVSDGTVMCNTFGYLNCSGGMSASSVPTPNIDEDCDNRWDNSIASPSGGVTRSLGAKNLGDSYSCPPAPSGTSFIAVQALSNFLTFSEYRDWNTTCSGTPTFFSPTDIAVNLHGPSGTLPGPAPFGYAGGNLMHDDPIWGYMLDPTSTDCQIYARSWSRRLSVPITQWREVVCYYSIVPSHTYTYF